MSDKPILFYSPSCKFSIDLWNKLKQLNILDSITKINVNTSPIPPYVTSVPTLKVKDRPLLQGNSIEMFFKSYMPPVENSKQETVVSSKPVEGSIQDYMPCEMGSCWSDTYSYIDNENPINHSYSFLNENIAPTISTSSGGGTLKSDKKDDFSRKLEDLKSSRDTDLSNKQN